MATVISFATRERQHTADRSRTDSAGDRAERAGERRTRQLARTWGVAEDTISADLYYNAAEILTIARACRKGDAAGRARVLKILMERYETGYYTGLADGAMTRKA
jgi:hypothetical protein